MSKKSMKKRLASGKFLGRAKARKAKAVVAKRRRCGCQGRSLFIVRTPGKVKATKCKLIALKLIKRCQKKAGSKSSTKCAWVKVSGVKATRRKGGKDKKK
jgi:hypothetical protein